MSTPYPIPEAALRESVAVVGRTGSGKSYAIRGAVETLLREDARVCIIDPTGVWHGLRSNAKGTGPGFPVVIFGGDHADVPIADTSGAALADLVATKNVPVVVDLSEFTVGGRTRFATHFLEDLYRKNRGPLTLVVDEADIFAPQRAMPDQTVMLSRMEQICRRGRVRGFRPWLITQRPAELHKSVLSQANTLVAMQLTAPQDRDAIGAWIEGQADRDQGKRVLAELPRLKKGEAWVWSPSHDVLERVKFPAITTFDSGRTPEEGEAAPTLKLAQVDLALIGESFKQAEAEAAANDPKRLRARIAELEGQLGKTGRAAPSKEDLEASWRAGFAAGRKEREHLIYGLIPKIRSALAEAVHEKLNEMVTAIAVEPSAPAPPKMAGNGHGKPYQPSPALRQRIQGDASMTKAERLILTALAQYPGGRSKSQIAILTGYAVNGGGFSNALSSCRANGWLEGSGGALRITAAGAKALGPVDPLPTGRGLLDYWYGQLARAERKALESLAEVYPRSLSKAQLASRAGYEANGGGFNNALSKLRTLELIGGRAELKASDDLFN